MTIENYYVDDVNHVYAAVGFELIKPTPKIVSLIQCDSDRYSSTEEDTTVCNASTGVAIQLMVYLKRHKPLATLPYFVSQSPLTLKECYQCDKPVPYLFGDSRCSDCTRLSPRQVTGN